jgi:hypothetical protein
MKKLILLIAVLMPLALLAQTTNIADSTKYNSIVKYYSRLITPQTTDASAFFKRGDAYNSRGIAKHLLGDNAGSCADFKKALELGNTYAQENLDKFCK